MHLLCLGNIVVDSITLTLRTHASVVSRFLRSIRRQQLVRLEKLPDRGGGHQRRKHTTSTVHSLWSGWTSVGGLWHLFDISRDLRDVFTGTTTWWLPPFPISITRLCKAYQDGCCRTKPTWTTGVEDHGNHLNSHTTVYLRYRHGTSSLGSLMGRRG